MAPLKRPVQPMPADVAQQLDARALRDAYDARPAYQRNDWLAWIGRAKQDETRGRRISEMLDELEAGEGYMGMDWQPAKGGPR